MKKLLLIGYFIIMGGGLAVAQRNTEPLRFYLTGSRGISKHEVFFPNSTGWATAFSFPLWRISAGTSLSPRLALETTWLHINNERRGGAYGTMLDGRKRSQDYYNSLRAWGLPVTARYTLTRKATRRLQVEALAGMSYVKVDTENEEKRMEGNDVTYYSYTELSGSGVYAMLGAGARFSITRHLELVGDYGFNRILKNVDGDAHRQIIGNSTGLTRNRSIGLRYRFNFKINKAKTKEETVAP